MRRVHAGSVFGCEFVEGFQCGERNAAFQVITLVILLSHGIRIIPGAAGTDTGGCATKRTTEHSDLP